METLQNTPMHEIYPILEWDNVSKKTVPYAFFDEDGRPFLDAPKISNSMQMTVHEKGAVGIAANQCGLPWRIIWVNGLDSALFNPKIVETGNDMVTLEEASLSHPGLIVKIKRPDVIRLRFTDATGVGRTRVFSGLTSRVIQRKMQILDGELFYKIANPFHREKALKKWKKT